MLNILITGISSGIGYNVATYLHHKGFRVIGTSRNPQNVSTAFEIIHADITDEVSVRHAVTLAQEKFGGAIDVLINNAGYGLFGPFEATSMEEAHAQFETNYFGVVRMTKAVLPQMRQHRSGRIITIGSMAGLIGMPFQGHYSASKYALEGLTEALRLELLPFNIQVTIIDPGDFKTSFTSNRHTVALPNVPDQYHDRFNQMLALYQSEEQNGSNPIIIAKHIEKLLTTKATPKVRYVLGKRLQTIGVVVKRIIGDTYFEKILRMMWKL